MKLIFRKKLVPLVLCLFLTLTFTTGCKKDTAAENNGAALTEVTLNEVAHSIL